MKVGDLQKLYYITKYSFKLGKINIIKKKTFFIKIKLSKLT